MKFKSFTLDDFQEEAVRSINKDNSVVVSAATGTGKTLIADYVIDKYHDTRRIIYTAPIKALSAQKFRDFRKDYGEETVGIMTGDVVINPDAPVLVMTTEIYRNMLLDHDPIVDDVKYVVFDEIHYINDRERGTVWEESVIYSPKHVRFLCLSATIPNAREFADWIQSIKKHKVDVVTHMKRAVPLSHNVYDIQMGITSMQDYKEDMEIPDYYKATKQKRKRKRQKKMPEPNHVELIKRIKDKTPAIVFDFSRNKCEKKAIELARKLDFSQKGDKQKIIELKNELISPQYRSLESVQKLFQCLSKGIAFHHAGVLPKAKELVERLFAEGMIKVLYATETFAVGINMPAKTVCFASLEKYDGYSFRFLNSKEYFQMAGRAGRRGIDTKGYVISMVQRGYTDINKLISISDKDDIPLQSQFQLSYNTVLNLIKNHPEKQREHILKMNFGYFLKKKKHDKQVRIMASYNNKLRTLERMGFLQDGKLTDKGMFATRIYAQELLTSEVFCSDIYKQLSPAEINILVATIIYEPRRRDYFTLKGIQRRYNHMVRVLSKHDYIIKNTNKLHLKRMTRTVGDFSEGASFKDVMDLSNLEEGDLIRLFRRIIDMVKQIRHATTDYDLKETMNECVNGLYRDVVKFEF